MSVASPATAATAAIVRAAATVRAAMRLTLGVWIAAGFVGCLPDLADDATLAALLAAHDDADATAQLNDADGADTVTTDAAVDGAETLADGSGGDAVVGTDSDAVSADISADVGDSVDAGDGNLGASCSKNSDCFKPANGAPCQVAICATGTCALTAAEKNAHCVAVGLTLQPCQETRCTVGGDCAVTTAADGTGCDADDNGCTVGDLCISATCSKGPKKICPSGSNACAPESCVSTGAQSALCKPHFSAEGQDCDDGDPCTQQDACDGAGVCGGVSLNCDAFDGPCTDGGCTVAAGACFGAPKASKIACDDGDSCTGSGFCDGAGACAGLKSVCDDSNACTDDVCDKTGACSHLPHTGACSDADPCTVGDVCDGKGSCLSGVPRLFDKAYDAALGVIVHGALGLSGGGALALGERSGSPWLARNDGLGDVIVPVKTPGYIGQWTRALERSDGGWIAAGVGVGVADLEVPIVGRFGNSGVEAWVVPINAFAATKLSVAAVLETPSINTSAIVLREQLSGGAFSTKVLIFDETQKKPTGNPVSLGGQSDPSAVFGGVREPAFQCWILVGRHKVNGVWKAWIYRLNDSLIGGGDNDFAVAPSQSFHAVVLAPGGGYYIAGSHDKSSPGQEVAWLVHVSGDMKQIVWQQSWGTDTGAVANGVVVSKAGDLLVTGFASTGNNAADTAGLAWRTSPFGATLDVKLFAAGGGGFNGAGLLTDGYFFVGDSGVGSTRKARFVRTTHWLHASCADAGGCAALATAACNDGDPCTADSCAPGKSCTASPLPSGAPCATGKVCSASAKCP